MKKIISILIICISLFNVFVFSAFASVEKTEQIEYFDDGSYMITYIETSTVRALSVKTTSKSANYYDKNDNILWRVTLTGTFSYTGTSSTCTASTVASNIYDSSWKLTEATASKSGNTATGTFVVKKYLALIPTQTQNVNLTLSCSANGIVT